jgi:hypothetical protein
VERRPASSPWLDFVWSIGSVLPGTPEASPWTIVSQQGETATFFAGSTDVELFRSETPNYRENLSRDVPQLWVVLRPTGVNEPAYQLFAVTADPAEGEAFTEAGSDFVEPAPMPAAVRESLEAFVAENPFEREFFKRERDRADPEALARRTPGTHRR